MWNMIQDRVTLRKWTRKYLKNLKLIEKTEARGIQTLKDTQTVPLDMNGSTDAKIRLPNHLSTPAVRHFTLLQFHYKTILKGSYMHTVPIEDLISSKKSQD